MKGEDSKWTAERVIEAWADELAEMMRQLAEDVVDIAEVEPDGYSIGIDMWAAFEGEFPEFIKALGQLVGAERLGNIAEGLRSEVAQAVEEAYADKEPGAVAVHRRAIELYRQEQIREQRRDAIEAAGADNVVELPREPA